MAENKASKKKYLADRMKDGMYVRAWKEGRGEYVVQVWFKPNCEGEPDGDWGMPGVLGLEGAIAQAILNTKRGKEMEDARVMEAAKVTAWLKGKWGHLA